MKSLDVLRTTADLRAKMLAIWARVDEGNITAQEARVHIGIARTVLDSLKVEIAAAHLSTAELSAVPLGASRAVPLAASRSRRQ